MGKLFTNEDRIEALEVVRELKAKDYKVKVQKAKELYIKQMKQIEEKIEKLYVAQYIQDKKDKKKKALKEKVEAISLKEMDKRIKDFDKAAGIKTK